MPAKVTFQQTPGAGPSSRRVQSRTSNPSQNDDSGSGKRWFLCKRKRCTSGGCSMVAANECLLSSAEGPTRRRLQKAAPNDNSNSDASTNPTSHPSNGASGSSRTSVLTKRRLSIRDQKVPQGPRPQESSRRRYSAFFSSSVPFPVHPWSSSSS